MLASDDIAHKAFVLLLLGNALNAQHEYLVVAEELVKHETVKATAETLVSVRIERYQHDSDVELVPCGRRQTQEAVLKRVLDDVVVLEHFAEELQLGERLAQQFVRL